MAQVPRPADLRCCFRSSFVVQQGEAQQLLSVRKKLRGWLKQIDLCYCREGFGPDDLRTVGMQSVIVDPNVTFTPKPNAAPQAMFQYCEGETGCTKVFPQVVDLSSAFSHCTCHKASFLAVICRATVCIVSLRTAFCQLPLAPEGC